MVIQELLAYVASRLGARRRLLVALSGGLDSTILLYALAQLKTNGGLPDLALRAIHIHHGLSRYADEWSQHCHRLCYEWNVPVQTIKVQLSTQHKGIEAAAREARYEAMSHQLQLGETLVTAQHLDDQCETFLLALKRGSGPAGLSAMAEVMPFHQGELLRPLLAISRRQLETCAQEVGLSWIEDDSNQDDRFDRNFLRLRVLPEMSARWPHFAESVARSAALCGEQERLLDELLADLLLSLVNADNAISIDELKPISDEKRYALLRRWIASFGAMMPAREQLQRLWHEVALSREDAEPQLLLGQWQARRFRQRLYLLPLFSSLKEMILPWDSSTSLRLPEGLGELNLGEKGIRVRAPRAEEQVTIRFIAQGKESIVGRQHSRPIKKLWQELNIPPWARERTPMLYFNEQLIAALGVFVTKEGECVENEPMWCIHWDK